MSRRSTFRSIWITAAAVTVACAAPSPATGGDAVVPAGSTGSAPIAGRTIKVVTTTTVLTDFARQVGGNGASVHGVLKANIDPHDFDPSPADLEAIAEADVIVKNGGGLEDWFERTIAAAKPGGIIVDASQGVTMRVLAAGDHDDSSATPEDDPHIWHDPTLAKTMVANIEKGFAEANPAGATGFAANARAYQGALDALDRETKAQIDTLDNKRLVTNHDAFHYYVDRYGLEFVGSIIPSFDSAAEMSAAEREELVAKLKKQGVKAVFSESSLPPKTAEAIAQEAGVKVVQGDDALYGDSLGPEGSDGATYLDAQRHNTRVIVDNLR